MLADMEFCRTFATAFEEMSNHHDERAFSSAGSEHLPYKQRVGGSNPSTPTKSDLSCGKSLFCLILLPIFLYLHICQYFYTMRKSSLLWSFLLLLVVGVGYYFFKKGMRVPDPVMQEVLANVHIPETSDTWFRHAPIDTLYSRHSYTYFCFVSSAYVGDVDDVAAAGDSVLILTSESSFSRYPASADVLPLPESAISYILPYGAPIAFFRVDSVVKTGNSFRYKLSRSR